MTKVYNVDTAPRDVNVVTETIECIHTATGPATTIPANLADLTIMVMSLHRANGSLGWVEDVVFDAAGSRSMNDYDINEYMS